MHGIDVVINTVGPSKNFNKEHSYMIDLKVNKLLIDSAKLYQIKKFILVSTMIITRPHNLIHYFLNAIMGDSLKYKFQAENYLRLSGLNYIILRPGGLKGKKQPKNL